MKLSPDTRELLLNIAVACFVAILLAGTIGIVDAIVVRL